MSIALRSILPFRIPPQHTLPSPPPNTQKTPTPISIHVCAHHIGLWYRALSSIIGVYLCLRLLVSSSLLCAYRIKIQASATPAARMDDVRISGSGLELQAGYCSRPSSRPVLPDHFSKEHAFLHVRASSFLNTRTANRHTCQARLENFFDELRVRLIAHLENRGLVHAGKATGSALQGIDSRA